MASRIRLASHNHQDKNTISYKSSVLQSSLSLAVCSSPGLPAVLKSAGFLTLQTSLTMLLPPNKKVSVIGAIKAFCALALKNITAICIYIRNTYNLML